MADTAYPLTGECLCGAIAYSCSKPPICVYHCYCRDCQRAGGVDRAVNALFARDVVIVHRGEPVSFSVLSETGSNSTRQFCGTCGSPLFALLERAPQILSVRVGTLDNPDAISPELAIWTSRQWRSHNEASALKEFSHNPDDTTFLELLERSKSA